MTDDYGPGTTIRRAAELAAGEAARTGLPVHKFFNGTPLDALPGDDSNTVIAHWATERQTIQARAAEQEPGLAGPGSGSANRGPNSVAMPTLAGLYALVADWEANGNSRELGDPAAAVWHQAARQLLDAIGDTDD